ncbi:hypothetical protein [Rubrivirga sp. IMCC45206]|uniref:hypothetical protein n=1 Tax=Rubrivirga sp. IMCC45206 TaxID=3391614 RepID=UPI0039903470
MFLKGLVLLIAVFSVPLEVTAQEAVPPWHNPTAGPFEPLPPSEALSVLYAENAMERMDEWERLTDEGANGYGWTLESFPMWQSVLEVGLPVTIQETNRGVSFQGDPARHVIRIDIPGGVGFTGTVREYPIWFGGEYGALVDAFSLLQNTEGIARAELGIPIRAVRELITNPTWYTPVRGEEVDYEVITLFATPHYTEGGWSPERYTGTPGLFREPLQTEFEVVMGGSNIFLRAYRRVAIRND